ncbi:MAG: sigma-54-dependent Fis family transcriptional regulator [Myxococcales bacterium]|jgi:two-component system nitrogen regulation response regulator GlnG/two-component system response regulator HydG|nr:sigma-54-dependent Fis family transcriptional regulator [Myxococcales bacterium]
MSDETQTEPGRVTHGEALEASGPLALMIAWSREAPARTGELCVVPRGSKGAIVGRGPARPDDPAPRLSFGPRRLGSPSAPLGNQSLSRVQFHVYATDEQLRVVRVGKAPLVVDGVETQEHVLSEGEVCLAGAEVAFACVRAVSPGGPTGFAANGPDEHGIVGESGLVWALRDELVFYAARDAHVLIQGPSGAGKELCARALHAMSARARGPFVARNAATLPAGIIDAELFGNAKNYPNAGMRERAGLVGEADGGTLFLDELGELPEAQQSHLLRVLDEGEYHRLGEDRPRKASVRLLAATNRATAALKHDLVARFKLRLSLPGLNERREDVPLLARHLLKSLAERDEGVRARFFEGGEPRVEPSLVAALVAHEYTTHVRELESLLLASMATSKGGWLGLTRAVSERLAPAHADTSDVGKEQIEAALKRTSGNVSLAWKLLGLSSRDALNRLIKKHGVVVRRS